MSDTVDAVRSSWLSTSESLDCTTNARLLASCAAERISLKSEVKSTSTREAMSDISEALTEVGVQGLTTSEVSGFGRQKGHTEIYRGAEYAISFVPKTKIEVAVDDDQVEKIVDAIRETAGTGNIGDGKIFVLDVTQAVRIRTGETNKDAL